MVISQQINMSKIQTHRISTGGGAPSPNPTSLNFGHVYLLRYRPVKTCSQHNKCYSYWELQSSVYGFMRYVVQHGSPRRQTANRPISEEFQIPTRSRMHWSRTGEVQLYTVAYAVCEYASCHKPVGYSCRTSGPREICDTDGSSSQAR